MLGKKTHRMAVLAFSLASLLATGCRNKGAGNDKVAANGSRNTGATSAGGNGAAGNGSDSAYKRDPGSSIPDTSRSRGAGPLLDSGLIHPDTLGSRGKGMLDSGLSMPGGVGSGMGSGGSDVNRPASGLPSGPGGVGPGTGAGAAAGGVR